MLTIETRYILISRFIFLLIFGGVALASPLNRQLQVTTYESVDEAHAGGRYTCAILKKSSTVRCWGANSDGQLGLGDTQNRGDEREEMGSNLPMVHVGSDQEVSALTLGSSHTCALLRDTSLKCWGSNIYGQAGLQRVKKKIGVSGEDMNDNLLILNEVENDFGTRVVTVKSVSAGHSQTCSILGDDTLKCWGSLLPKDSVIANPKKRIITDAVVKQVAVGDSHACAIFGDNSTRCWGNNINGQLGLGDVLYREVPTGSIMDDDTWPSIDLGTDRTARYIALGYAHTCVILDNDSVKCWGWNYDGQLGMGDNENRGDFPHEMGDNLKAIDVGLNLKVKQISLGYYHTCAILSNDSLKCWGFNKFGQLGLGDTYNRGLLPKGMGENLPPVKLGFRVKQVTAGFGHTCAVLGDNSLKCWGLNDSGQLGLGDDVIRGSAKHDMDSLARVDLNESYAESYTILERKGAAKSTLSYWQFLPSFILLYHCWR